MKRLTYEADYCEDIAYCNPRESSCPEGGCLKKQLWEKLKAYEDTGLSPSEITAQRLGAPSLTP